VFLPLLYKIISPPIVGLVLNIHLVVAEIGSGPLITDDRTEPLKRAVKWPIDHAMVMKSVIGAHFQHRYKKKAPVMLSGAATKNPTFQPGPEVTKIL
jgi:hypothetical protein